MHRCLNSNSKAKGILAVILSFIVISGASFVCPDTVVFAKDYTISGETSKKLYEDPSESSNVVANIIPGNTFTILETVKDDDGKNWHHVSLFGGVTGYIMTTWVIEVEEEESQAPAAPAAKDTEENTAEQNDQEEEAEEANQEETEEANQEEADEAKDPAADEADEEADEPAEDEVLSNISVTTLSNINLRADPSLNGNVLVVIPRGITITPYEKVNKDNYYWYRLSYLGQTGYIRADAVKETEIEEETEEEDGEEGAEEGTEEVTDENSVRTSTTITPMDVRHSSTTSVSYSDSYERRHKWDDPETSTVDVTSTSTRHIDIFVIMFVGLALSLIVIAAFLLKDIFQGFKKHYHIRRKKRKYLGRGNERKTQ